MCTAVDKLNAFDFNYWKINSLKNSPKNSADNQNINLSDYGYEISFNNKEKNKQDLQNASKLISLLESDEIDNLEKAYGDYLTCIWDDEQYLKDEETLECINMFSNIEPYTLLCILRMWAFEFLIYFRYWIVNLVNNLYAKQNY